MNTEEKKPRITYMGEEIAYDDVPEPQAIEMLDYFKPVKLSPRSIDEASRAVPLRAYEQSGLYTWLQQRADFVFSKLPVSQTEGRFGRLRYSFEFDADGPVLKTVTLEPPAPAAPPSGNGDGRTV